MPLKGLSVPVTTENSGAAVTVNAEADGAVLEIPARETGVLRALLLANGRTLSKGQLIESLSSFDEDISENAVEQYVSRLRRRLSDYGVSIKAARGLGYYLQTPDEKQAR